MKLTKTELNMLRDIKSQLDRNERLGGDDAKDGAYKRITPTLLRLIDLHLITEGVWAGPKHRDNIRLTKTGKTVLES